MSDDDLTIAQKLRTTYFRALIGALIALIGVAAYYFATVTEAFPYEGLLVIMWLLLFGMVIWLLGDFLELVDRNRRRRRTADDAFLNLDRGHD